MKLLRTTVWLWYDIALLKWCCLLIGMIAGAYFAEYVKSYAGIIAVAAFLLAIRPFMTYFGVRNRQVKLLFCPGSDRKPLFGGR